MAVDAGARARTAYRLAGSIHSFEDLEQRDVGEFDYKLEGDAIFDGQPCWKIESKPKDAKSSQYTSSLILIRRDNYVVIQIENFSKDKLVRSIHYSDVRQQDGIWVARTMEALDANRGSRTVLKLENLRYNIPLKEESFTLEALRRG